MYVDMYQDPFRDGWVVRLTLTQDDLDFIVEDQLGRSEDEPREVHLDHFVTNAYLAKNRF